jgi:hypothetical protein
MGFDDGYFGPERMEAEIASAGETYPSLPDVVPPGTLFSFGRYETGHLASSGPRLGTTQDE